MYITFLYLLLLDSEVHKYLFVYNYLLACKRASAPYSLFPSAFLSFNKRAKERKGGALKVIIARK